MNRHDLHEFMDIIAAVCTIVVSIVAVWGTLTIWSSGIWHKVKHLVNHYHAEIIANKKADQISGLNMGGKSQ